MGLEKKLEEISQEQAGIVKKNKETNNKKNRRGKQTNEKNQKLLTRILNKLDGTQ